MALVVGGKVGDVVVPGRGTRVGVEDIDAVPEDKGANEVVDVAGGRGDVDEDGGR